MEGQPKRDEWLMYMGKSFVLWVIGGVLMFTLPSPLPYFVPVVVVPVSFYLGRHVRPAKTPPHRPDTETRDRL